MIGRARILVIDNYDSFTFNLVQALGVLGGEVEVAPNDRISLDEVRRHGPTHVVTSPGPGRPEDAAVSVEVMRAAIAGRLGDARVLGVCLGHQCLAYVAGARVVAARHLVHGRASAITHDGRGLFDRLPTPLRVGRYHSLAVDEHSLPSSLAVTARAEDGEVMALAHHGGRVHGVQFHPESVLTPDGMRLLDNFLNGGVR